MRIGAFGSWVTLVACGGACAEPPEPAAPRCVVLIVVDTLRADRLGCYGYERPTSPAIDALAADGLRFEHAVSAAPWTLPSIASLLTSRPPGALGIGHRLQALPDDALTLAEVLAGRGWRTGAVVSHSFCSSRWNFDQGFERFDESNVLGHDGVSSPGVVDRAIELVDAFAPERFFLLVHLFDPHFAFIEHSDHVLDGPEPYDGPVESGMVYTELRKLDLAPEDLRRVGALYDSEIAFTDRHVGRLLDHLRARGLYDDAAVVLTADHGEELLEHGRVGHAWSLYEELLHVPLIVKAPGLAPGVRAETVSSLDVMPSVLALADVGVKEPLAGRSLLDPPAARPAFSATDRHASLRSVVLDGLKLVHDRETGLHHLYDLRRDPRETTDVLAERPEDARRLTALLSAHEAALAGSTLAPGTVEIGAEEERRLEELGYAGD